MKVVKFGSSVRGASHIITGTVCQDANLLEEAASGIYVASVSDGHGSERCPYSAKGAENATKVFTQIVKNAYFSAKGKEEKFVEYLRHKIFPQLVCEEWKNLVKEEYENIKKIAEGEIPEYSDELFGCTLLGIVLTGEYIYAFQIGDGDIVYVDKDTTSRVIVPDKFLGTETYSLCNEMPWKNAVTQFQRIDFSEKIPFLVMLSSDGFANSFLNDTVYLESCRDYYDTFLQYGDEVLQSNLEQWLSDTSREGCGDDITLLAIGFVADDCEWGNPEETEE